MSQDSSFSLIDGVKRCKNRVLKNTLRVLIKRQGKSEPEFYRGLGLSKQYWYMISWGIEETPQSIRIKISRELDTDTSLIWLEVKNEINGS